MVINSINLDLNIRIVQSKLKYHNLRLIYFIGLSFGKKSNRNDVRNFVNPLSLLFKSALVKLSDT